MFGKNKIIKTIKIDKMKCEHCAKKVEEALKEVKEVSSVKVDLSKKEATVKLKKDIDMKILKDIIKDLGYTVIEN